MTITLDLLRDLTRREHSRRGIENTQRNYQKLVREIMNSPRETFDALPFMRGLWDIMRTNRPASEIEEEANGD